MGEEISGSALVSFPSVILSGDKRFACESLVAVEGPLCSTDFDDLKNDKIVPIIGSFDSSFPFAERMESFRSG
jgi:hypothetical protein